MPPAHPDINAALVERVKNITPDRKARFLSTFSRAALMLKFLEFLEGLRQEAFTVPKAVLYLYGIKASHSQYKVYENRFFKLRRKTYDFFTSSAPAHPSFAPQELLLHDIKNLFTAGKYDEAYPLLISLEERLWKENIFELIPEVLDMIIYANQVQRTIERNKPFYARLHTASALLARLNEARMLARQVYDINFTLGVKAAAPLFIKLQRLSIKHKAYPRFKLIYNLISATCKLGGGGLDFKPDFKITNRFISTINSIHARHPNMPDYRLLAGYSDMQSYIFENLQMMSYFNSMQFKEAAEVMKRLYNLVTAEGSGVKRMLGPAFFTTACQAFAAGGRYADMLATARHYLAHMLKTGGRTMEPYFEIISAHIGLHPAKSGYSDKFIADKIESLIKFAKTQEYSFYYIAAINWQKVKFLLINHHYSQALKVFQQTDFTHYFIDKSLRQAALDTILVLPQNSPDKVLHDRIGKLRVLKLKTTVPGDYTAYTFLETQLQKKQKNAGQQNYPA